MTFKSGTVNHSEESVVLSHEYHRLLALRAFALNGAPRLPLSSTTIKCSLLKLNLEMHKAILL